jgi:hypothetical protein
MGWSYTQAASDTLHKIAAFHNSGRENGNRLCYFRGDRLVDGNVFGFFETQNVDRPDGSIVCDVYQFVAGGSIRVADFTINGDGTVRGYRGPLPPGVRAA